MNPDLKKERTNSKVDVAKLTEFLGKSLFGSVDRFEKMNSLRKKVVERIKPLVEENYENLDREEKYEMNLKKSLEMIEFAKEHKLDDSMEYTYLIGAVMGNEKQVFGLHFSMFSISLDLWSTPEQRDYWKTFMDKNTVFGTYIQTELGHGTFVRGLETTATYDRSTDEFIINTPTLTATKFWAGSSGKTCNFCVLMAELIIDGKKFGIHAFVVQLRSLDDHMPMKGIELGDIGKKYGYDPIDNGFVRFNNYRIPRFNMLMRFSQVNRDGVYKRVGNEQIMYACMLIMRSVMCMFASLLLSMSTTIAVRYSCVRRQTAGPNGIEPQIMDYQTQQNRILSGLGTSYAFLFSTMKFRNIVNSVRAKTNYFQTIQQTDLARLHALSSGLKAVIFEESLKYAHINRHCCGGHGYSSSSGLPAIIHETDAGCTYEGDNIILLLQTARYLLKCAQKNISPHLTLSNMAEIKTSEIYKRFETILSFSEKLFDRLLDKISDRMVKLITEDGLSEYDAWNNSSVLLLQLSKAYIQIFINTAFLSYLYSHLRESSTSNQQALTELFELYLHYGVVELNSAWLMRLGIINGEDLENYLNRYLKLLSVVRKDAVCLVDSFNWSDNYLASTLGAYDGNVYERLFQFAKNSKFNQKAENYGWFKNYINNSKL